MAIPAGIGRKQHGRRLAMPYRCSARGHGNACDPLMSNP
jgi:hypothetical protein